MFLNVLLVLAVFFQACRIEAYYYGHTGEEIPGGVEVGKALKVIMNEKGSIKIFIKTEPESVEAGGGGDIGLFFTFTNDYYGKVIANTRANGDWGKEQSYYNDNMSITRVEIVVEKDFFDISFNGRQYIVKHQVPIETLKYWELKTHIHIDGFRWFRQFAPYTCQTEL